MTDETTYQQQRAAAQSWFQSLRPVHSPALSSGVHFTSEGFEHIIYKRARAERERSTQIMRFTLLPRAIELLSLSTTFQEYEETTKLCVIKRKKKKVQVPKLVQYWGIIAIYRGRKIKVIVRKVGNGKHHFWSVIPAWVTNTYRDVKFISTMKGVPEED